MILMLIALTNLFPKALNAFSRFHSVVIHLMLPLLFTYLSIRTSLEVTGCLVEELPEVEKPVENPVQRDPMDESQCDPRILDNSAKDFNTLADIYWPESLGPLDLDIPSSKYHSEDLILSDSLCGLNRLIASSLDAFQNCSFFGLDKKESASAVEAQEATSFPNFTIDSGV